MSSKHHHKASRSTSRISNKTPFKPLPGTISPNPRYHNPEKCAISLDSHIHFHDFSTITLKPPIEKSRKMRYPPSLSDPPLQLHHHQHSQHDNDPHQTTARPRSTRLSRPQQGFFPVFFPRRYGTVYGRPNRRRIYSCCGRRVSDGGYVSRHCGSMVPKRMHVSRYCGSSVANWGHISRYCGSMVPNRRRTNDRPLSHGLVIV